MNGQLILVGATHDRYWRSLLQRLGFFGAVIVEVAQADVVAQLVAERDAAALVVDEAFSLDRGQSLCRSARTAGYRRPILVLLENWDDKTALSVLLSGATLTVEKASCGPLVVARTIAGLIAHCVPSHRRRMRQFANLIIDLEGSRAYVGDRDLHLTRTEYEILLLLSDPVGRIVARDRLLGSLLAHRVPHAEMPSERVLDSHISHLRRKLEAAEVGVQAIRGFGYRFACETGSIGRFVDTCAEPLLGSSDSAARSMSERP